MNKKTIQYSLRIFEEDKEKLKTLTKQGKNIADIINYMLEKNFEELINEDIKRSFTLEDRIRSSKDMEFIYIVEEKNCVDSKKNLVYVEQDFKLTKDHLLFRKIKEDEFLFFDDKNVKVKIIKDNFRSFIESKFYNKSFEGLENNFKNLIEQKYKDKIFILDIDKVINDYLKKLRDEKLKNEIILIKSNDYQFLISNYDIKILEGFLEYKNSIFNILNNNCEKFNLQTFYNSLDDNVYLLCNYEIFAVVLNYQEFYRFVNKERNIEISLNNEEIYNLKKELSKKKGCYI